MDDISIYQTDSGALEVRLQNDTVWLRQEQMSQLFGRDRSVIGKHLRNIFTEEELEQNSVCAKYAHTAADGKTYQVEHFNLDVIISVGYRVKSLQGTRFRQWATRVLREHLATLSTASGWKAKPPNWKRPCNWCARLLVAESDPAQKDTLIKLVMNMPAGGK